MKLKNIILSTAAVVTLVACEKKFDSLLTNPNNPSPETASADLYLNQVQLSFAGFFDASGAFGREVTRQMNWFGPTYINGYTPNSFDGVWNTAYTGVFKHANALIPIASKENKWVNVAMAKIMKAYTMMTLVDLFGDVPYDEANLGSENTNPKVTPGKDVYAKAITLLNEAIADLAKTPGAFPGNQDLFFQTSNSTGIGRWRKTAKTLLLRAYLNTRLVDNTAKTKIDALIAENDLISSGTADDFEFKYGSKNANPDNRHPDYANNYNAAGSAGDYVSTWFMYAMAEEKGLFSNTESRNNADPRTRYYLYRQRVNFNEADETSASCLASAAPAHYPADMPYCLINAPGFWGRDHGDNSGIPPDANRRTTFGIYPAGGDFDANQGTTVTLVRGGRGQGILPLWQASYTTFARAEGALILGTVGDPRALLEQGVRQSISKVVGYPATIGFSVPADLVPTSAKVDDYVGKVMALYDAATTQDAKLNVIMKEWYLALWGNGNQLYNNIRRTGKPTGMQFARLAAPGEFTRSMLYPSSSVNLNINAKQRASVGERVFWDTNPPGFIK
jgi:hypothetical protein